MYDYSISGCPTSVAQPIKRKTFYGKEIEIELNVLQGGSMPNTSSSVPFLLSSSMQSIRSRRPSACLTGSQGSGLLQQLGSGMVRQLSASQQSNGRAFPGANVRQCPSLTVSRFPISLCASGTALSVAHTRHTVLTSRTLRSSYYRCRNMGSMPVWFLFLSTAIL